MYINEEIYNWKELKGEDKAFIDGYNEGCANLIESAWSLLDDATADMIKPFADIYKEVGAEIIAQLTTLVEVERGEITARIMDGKPEVYYEQ